MFFNEEDFLHYILSMLYQYRAHSVWIGKEGEIFCQSDRSQVADVDVSQSKMFPGKFLENVF